MYLTKKPVIIGITKDRKGDNIISYNRPYNLKEFIESPSYYELKYKKYPFPVLKKLVTYKEIYLSTTAFYVNKLTGYLDVISQYYYYLSKLVEKIGLEKLNSEYGEKYFLPPERCHRSMRAYLVSFLFHALPDARQCTFVQR